MENAETRTTFGTRTKTNKAKATTQKINKENELQETYPKIRGVSMISRKTKQSH